MPCSTSLAPMVALVSTVDIHCLGLSTVCEGSFRTSDSDTLTLLWLLLVTSLRCYPVVLCTVWGRGQVYPQQTYLTLSTTYLLNARLHYVP